MCDLDAEELLTVKVEVNIWLKRRGVSILDFTREDLQLASTYKARLEEEREEEEEESELTPQLVAFEALEQLAEYYSREHPVRTAGQVAALKCKLVKIVCYSVLMTSHPGYFGTTKREVVQNMASFDDTLKGLLAQGLMLVTMRHEKDELLCQEMLHVMSSQYETSIVEKPKVAML